MLSSALALTLASCSCEGTTTDQQPALSWTLESDPTGRGDYLLDFGLVPTGSQVILPISIRNIGNTTLILQVPQPSGPFFRELVGDVLRVEVGQTVELGFGFAPEGEGAVQQLVTIVTNEPGDRANRLLRLSGSGVPPSLHCTPSPLDFGQVVRGSEASQSLRCTNPLGIPLEVSPGKLSGNHAGAFSLGGPADLVRTVDPLASFEIDVAFRAEVSGTNDASLAFRGSANQLLATVPIVAEVVHHALVLEPSTCLDFGFIAVGETRRDVLHVRNVGTQDLLLQSAVVADQDGGDFSVEFPSPVPLGAGGEEAVAIPVAFHPTQGGQRTSSILLSTDGAEPLSACITGFGGGPRIGCSPDALDFGQIALGMPRSRSFRCVNQGEAPPDVAEEPMYIDGISSDHPAFQVELHNDDGSTGPRREGYRIGEGFHVEVRFDPADEDFHEGTIRLETLAEPSGAHLTRVSGSGLDLPPCDFVVLPPQLRFGVVDGGDDRTRILGIRNLGEHACLIDQLRLEEGSDPAFSAEAVDHVKLEGGKTLEVAVTFAPTDRTGEAEGAIVFGISVPDAPLQRVPLSGMAAAPCLLVDPAPLDFGNAGLGCHSRVRTVSLRNICYAPLVIEGVEIEGGPAAGSFPIISKPLLPKTLGSNEWMDVQIRFDPEREGLVTSALEVEVRVGPQFSFYLAELEGEAALQIGEKTDSFVQKAQRKVDILWVIDNSGSFRPYQERISANLPAFLSAAEEQGIDYQIGVTTTGLEPGSGCPGGAQGGEDGRLFPIDGSHPRILTPRTPNLAAHWSHNILVGTCHGLELAYEAAYRALSSPLINEEKDSRYRFTSPWNDGNAGFLRPDAGLSIIFVTDEVEQSTLLMGRTPASYIEFFRRVKGLQNTSQFKAHAITGPSEAQRPSDCTAEDGAGLREGVSLTGGQFLSICTPTEDHQAWEAGLRQMSGAAFSFGTRYFLSSEPAPLAGSGRVRERDLRVVVDGMEVGPVREGAQVWTYDSGLNAIDFSPLFIPMPDSTIEVTYQVACLVD